MYVLAGMFAPGQDRANDDRQMTCRCGQHYCYRCGARLEPSQPYKHYSTPGQRCFSKLFDMEAIDDEWQPVEGFDVI